MKKDEKITLWSERIHEFQSSGQTCKTWCQEHRIPVSTMNYWMRKLKTLDGQSDTDMIFAKMPTETEISKNETLNISPSPVRIFITILIEDGCQSYLHLKWVDLCLAFHYINLYHRFVRFIHHMKMVFNLH